MSGSHDPARELLGPYALGQLDDAGRAAVDAHLAECGRCRADLAEVGPVAALLGSVRERVVLDAPDPGPPPPLPRTLRARARRVPLLAASVAVLVAAGLAFGAGVVTATPDVPLEPVPVRVLDPAVHAEAALVPHTWGMEVRLVASGFVPGQAYRVTVVDDTGRAVGAGEFLGTGAEEMSCNLNSSVLRGAAASFQVVDAGGRVVLDARI